MFTVSLWGDLNGIFTEKVMFIIYFSVCYNKTEIIERGLEGFQSPSYIFVNPSFYALPPVIDWMDNTKNGIYQIIIRHVFFCLYYLFYYMCYYVLFIILHC